MKKITTGLVYNEFDKFIQTMEKFLATKRVRLFGCDSVQVKARIIQILVSLTTDDYTKEFLEVNKDSNTEIKLPRVFKSNGIKMNKDSGDIFVYPNQWLIQFFLFFSLWLRMFFHLVLSLFLSAPKKSKSTTILMEALGNFQQSNKEFVEFCRMGEIKALSSPKEILIKSTISPEFPFDPAFIYTNQPFIYLVKNNLQRSHRFALLLSYLKVPFLYIWAILFSPLTIIISRDIAYVSLVMWLDNKNLLDSVIVTNSAFVDQPIWMKGLKDQNFKLHMVWYSQNFIPKVYHGEEDKPNLPSARHMRVDTHWVWTPGFRRYLIELGQTSAEINVVGPILWYLPKEIKIEEPADYYISVFDITPMLDSKMAFGALKNYYSKKTISQFILDIVHVCDEIENLLNKKITIILKHKRAFKSGFHDESYFTFLDELVNTRRNFLLVDHQTNLFGLLKLSSISISVPYTSTVYVSSHLKKSAVYYDPFNEIIPLYEENPYVLFASNKEELKKIVLSCLQ